MFTKPRSVLMQLPVEPGQLIADFGAGSGHFAIEAARLVGGSGKVYAVEVNKKLVDRIQGEARSSRVMSLEAIWGDIEEERGSHLDDKSVHVVIFSNTLFQIDDKAVALMEAKRVLKDNGKLVVVDWSESFGGVGPHPEQVVYLEDAKRLVKEAGFDIDKMLTVGEHHYGFVSKKSL